MVEMVRKPPLKLLFVLNLYHNIKHPNVTKSEEMCKMGIFFTKLYNKVLCVKPS